MKKIFSIIIASLLIVNFASSQKFAHINTQQLLLDSPQIKKVDADLQAFQNQLIAKGEQMVKNFESEYKKYMSEVEAKTLSPLQMQQREEKLKSQQESIQKYQVEVQQKIAMKREELYKPILDNVKNVIDQIGREGQYTMIFDTATNGLVFAVESDDILAKVKSRLGW